MIKLPFLKKGLIKKAKANLKRPKRLYSKALLLVDRRPLTSFFTLLLVLTIVITVGNFLKKPKAESTKVEQPVKLVQVYSIGSTPKITVQAQIEKSGIVKIVSQTQSIVSQINVKTGQHVWRGTNLLSLSTNYGGSNPYSVQRQLAEAQYKNINDNLPAQKDLISKQRELADKNKDNADKLRDITDQSLGETRDLTSLNENLISNLQQTLQTQTPGTTAYIQTQEQISQFQSATNQIRQGLRNSEFQTNEDNPPAKIAELSNDIAKKQLDLQEKSLDLSRETSALQVKLAQINEASMFPVSPFEGVVERVNVQVGQTVTPGTVLATITGNNQASTAQAFVPLQIAKSITLLNPATLHFTNESVDLFPTYVSQEATEGQLYSVVFAIPAEVQSELTDRSFITIDLPLDEPAVKNDPYVPIDSVHQTQEESFVFVIKDKKATAKKVNLGQVQGSYVQVITGLEKDDQVIVSRNIIAGDNVEAKN